MQIKSILFGFGLGMVFLSSVFLIAYQLDRSLAGETTEEDIIEEATNLGMIWPTEDVAEIIRQALQMGMVFEEDVED
jgi:hypothetical protein